MDARATVFATVVLWLSAAPALAAPPAAQPDTMRAFPSGAADVLANDSDPDGDALQVSLQDPPAHGTASCAASGACFYRAAAGFTGSDAFTYSARDSHGEAAAATVDVSVTASTASGTPTARPDEASTRADAPVTIPVLANDDGSGLRVTSAGEAQHGEVSCDASRCTYTPQAGSTGRDGFTYVIQDDAEHSATGEVHVLVVGPGAGYALTSSGGPETVAPGGSAGFSAGVRGVPGADELAALPLPVLTFSLAGPQTLDGASTARGWTRDGGAVRATGDALLGEAVTEAFPKPLPPVSQGTGGDGHVPILVGTKVFAFYHHQHPTSVTCVDRATGQLCPGYPKPLDVGSSDIIGPAAVVGSRLYVHALPASGYAQTAPIALFCWDAVTDSTCGLTIVDRLARTSDPGASAPVVAGGRVWLGGDTGRLYCVDPATGSACGSLDTGLAPAQGAYYDIVTHGSRVFLSSSAAGASCVDVSSGAICPGWPKAFDGAWNLVTQHDASGAAVGVCVFGGATGSCLPDDGSPAIPVSNWFSTDNYYSNTLEAETGTRTLVGSLFAGGLGCYDWTTMKPCEGGGYQGGWLSQDTSGNGLPSAYGAAYDGSCAVGLGDPGRVFTVDPAGSSPCLSLSSGTSRTLVDLRDQRCDGTAGAARWSAVTLTDTNAEEMQSVVVTVRDAASGAVLASGDLVAGALDLSAIDVGAHPAVTVDATAKSTEGDHAWDDAVPPRLAVSWHSDPQTLCLRTTGTAQCSADATTPLELLAHLAEPAADTRRTLALRRDACPAPQSVKSAARELPPPVVGKTVNALPVSGTVRVKLPGTARFVDLPVGRQLPVGTTFDVRDGRVRLVTADGRGGTDTAEFYRGLFRLGQTTGRRPVTTLRLVEALDCSAGGFARSAARKPPKIRRLWGSGTGAFRTQGQYSSATVRGTTWVTKDSCISTVTRVRAGVVAVRDRIHHRTILLRAGGRYVSRHAR